MLMINQNDKNNTILPEIEAAKAIVLLHQQVDNHPESEEDTAAVITTPNELPNDDNDDSNLIQHLAKQQLIQNESSSSSSSSTVPAGVAAHDHDDKETTFKGLAKQGDDDPKSTVTTSIINSSLKLHTQSSDVGEKKKDQLHTNKKPSTMLNPRALAPLHLDLDSPPQERDDTTGITTMMTLPTSPMTCTKNKSPPVLLHSGMKRSCSPTHDAVGRKGPTKKYKLCLIDQLTTTAVPTVTAASSNRCDTNMKQQQPKPDNFIDLSMDDPSDDDDDEAIATTMTRSELDRVADMIGDSPEMKFVHLIGENLKGRPQETFKAITAKVMDYHSRQVGGTYKKLPKAILLQVRDRMEPSEYRGAYYAARAEWTKMYSPPYHNDSQTRMPVSMDQAPNGGTKYPLDDLPQEGTTGQIVQLWADPHNNHTRIHYPMAIRPGTETIRGGRGVIPSRNITTNQHRIPAGGVVVVAVPPRHNDPLQNPPNRRNVAIVSQSSMRIHSPVQATGEASTRSVTNHAHRSAGVPTRNNNSHSEHGEHHRSVPCPVVTMNRLGNRLQVAAATRSSPHPPPLSARPSSMKTAPDQRSVRVLSPPQPEVIVTTTRGCPTIAAYTRTAERPFVANHPTSDQTIVPEGTVNNNNNNSTSKSAMQLSLRFGFALCLKQQQRIRQRSTNYIPLSVEEIMAKAERKLNTMTPEERDQLWDEIKEFTEEECGM